MGDGTTVREIRMPRLTVGRAGAASCWGGIAVAIAVSALLGFTATPAAARAATAGPTVAARSKPPLCASSAVHVAATTNHSKYAPGQPVKMTSTITNVSSTPCSVWLGLDPGFSPSFIVVNAKHNEVWDRCWFHDRPGGCFEILYQHRLAPGHSYHTEARWDQGSTTSSRPPHQVPAGPYTVETYYQYIGGATVRLRIS